MIELDQVVKLYGARRAVDCVTLSVNKGELCALVGPSGCGKSTTLRLINRLVEPTSGTIRIDGRDVSSLPPETLRRGIGYAIQSIGLFPHWTVAENIAAVPRLHKWPERRIRDRIDELLRLLQLDPGEYAGKYPDQLSGGQRQRVGVARALAADPELLLMDEPFGALDPITRDELQAELGRIHRATGKTIILVTHDMAEALRLANRIAVMRDGRLVQSGSPLDILERPVDDFVRDFLGRARLGFARLSARRIADRLSPGETAEGAPISADLSLADALSEMLLRRVERLSVVASDGRSAGVVRLINIVR